LLYYKFLFYYLLIIEPKYLFINLIGYYCLYIISSLLLLLLRVIIFGSVRFLSIKTTKLNFFKKNWNRTEPGSNRSVSIRFGSVFDVKNQKNLYCFLTSKSHKIKPIFITSSPHDSVESITTFSQANSLLQNHKNTSRSLTVINHSSLWLTQKPTSLKTILSNTNHHHHNKHCPVPTATFFTHFPFIKKKTQQLPIT